MNNLEEKRIVLVIDGYHLLHKGYYGSLKRKDVAKNRDGITINAIYTFIAKINQCIDSKKYHTIIVTFDVGSGCWRRELYPEYKAKRKETPEDLIPQMQIIREFLTAANIPWYEMPNYEGDDVMGSIASLATFLGYKVEILSNDKDTYQLINDDVTVITKGSKKEKEVIIDAQNVEEIFQCKPYQIPDMKALTGDSSDNIKGIKGLHFDTAANLLSEYNSIDGIYKNIDAIDPRVANKLTANKDQVIMNKQLTTIKKDLKLGRINFKKLKVDYRGYLSFLKKHKMWAFTGSVNKRIQVEIEASKKAKAERELANTENKNTN